MHVIASWLRNRPRSMAPILVGLIVLTLAAIGFGALRWQVPAATERPATATATTADLLVLTVESVDQPGSVVGLPTGGGAARRLTNTDFDPAFAVTSSGDRIYVASGLDQDGVLRTVDARTGQEIAEVPYPDRWRNTLPAYFDVMTISPDDRWLYALSFQTMGVERDGYYFRVFDINRGQFLSEVIPLSDCVGGLALPGPSDLEIACPHSGVLLTTGVNGNGEHGVIATTEISQSGIAGSARLPRSQGTIVLTKEGKVVRVDRDGVKVLF